MKFRLKLVRFVRKKTTRLIEVSVLQLLDKCVSSEKDGRFKSYLKWNLFIHEFLVFSGF